MGSQREEEHERDEPDLKNEEEPQFYELQERERDEEEEEDGKEEGKEEDMVPNKEE